MANFDRICKHMISSKLSICFFYFFLCNFCEFCIHFVHTTPPQFGSITTQVSPSKVALPSLRSFGTVFGAGGVVDTFPSLRIFLPSSGAKNGLKNRLGENLSSATESSFHTHYRQKTPKFQSIHNNHQSNLYSQPLKSEKPHISVGEEIERDRKRVFNRLIRNSDTGELKEEYESILRDPDTFLLDLLYQNKPIPVTENALRSLLTELSYKQHTYGQQIYDEFPSPNPQHSYENYHTPDGFTYIAPDIPRPSNKVKSMHRQKFSTPYNRNRRSQSRFLHNSSATKSNESGEGQTLERHFDHFRSDETPKSHSKPVKFSYPPPLNGDGTIRYPQNPPKPFEDRMNSTPSSNSHTSMESVSSIFPNLMSIRGGEITPYNPAESRLNFDSFWQLTVKLPGNSSVKIQRNAKSWTKGTILFFGYPDYLDEKEVELFEKRAFQMGADTIFFNIISSDPAKLLNADDYKSSVINILDMILPYMQKPAIAVFHGIPVPVYAVSKMDQIRSMIIMAPNKAKSPKFIQKTENESKYFSTIAEENIEPETMEACKNDSQCSIHKSNNSNAMVDENDIAALERAFALL